MAREILKQKEFELWQDWKKTKSEEKLQELLNTFSPVIYKEVNKWSRSPLPIEVLETKAKVLAVKAFETYDPKKGVALATHLTNQLKPLSRLVYTHQNVARIPSEARIAKINTLKNIVEHYRTTFGRDPTVEELADELALPPRQIEKFLKELHPDFLASLAIAPFASKFDLEADSYIKDFYLSLNPREKLVFEYSVGYGKKQLSIEEIAKRLNTTVYEVRRIRDKLAKEFRDYINAVAPVVYGEKAMNTLESVSSSLAAEEQWRQRVIF